jgi:maltooligosyltrehalose trehalohydrolase
MLFQGQEFAASTPFLYFADHKKELADAVTRGRREFMDQFRSIATSDIVLARPDDPATFEASKLHDAERTSHTEALELHRELLALRRELRPPADGAVLGDEAFVLRFANDFLLIVNFGPQLTLEIMPEPLLAPPPGMEWRQRWSSEGVPFVTNPVWVVPAEAAILLEVAPETPSVPRPRRRASDVPGPKGPSPATEPPSASTSSSDRKDAPK